MPDSNQGPALFALTNGPSAPIVVGTERVFQAGIRVDAVEHAAAAAIDINLLILHDDTIALTDDRHWSLRIDPSRSQTALVTVPFQALIAGTTTVTVDFYHGLRWLKTLRVRIEMTSLATSESPPAVI